MNKETLCIHDGPPEGPADDSYPVFVPSVAVMISCADAKGRPNITPVVGWTVVSRFPFMVAVSLCHSDYSPNYFPRHSHRIISQTREYVLNIPHAGLSRAVSKTGEVSGRDPKVDKFALAGLTPGPGKTVRAPIIMECPINLECQVTQVVRAGSHDLFLARVTAIQTDPILRQEIRDESMMIEMLLDPDRIGKASPHRMVWRTLPDLAEREG